MAKRNLTEQERLELQEMQRVVSAKKFEAAQIKGNTALIPRGQEIFMEVDAIARLLDNARNGWVSAKLQECGYEENEMCTINLSTGEVLPTQIQKPDESSSSKKTD